MDALEQRVEVQSTVVGVGDHDLAIDDAAIGQLLEQRFDQLGEVARERPFVAAGEFDLVAVAEHDAAKAVPLGFVQPPVAVGNDVGRLGQHGRDRRSDRKGHSVSLPAASPSSQPGRPARSASARSAGSGMNAHGATHDN
jgi:hypothetical protein